MPLEGRFAVIFKSPRIHRYYRWPVGNGWFFNEPPERRAQNFDRALDAADELGRRMGWRTAIWRVE